MKTEFNVERVCERVQFCIVDAPESLGTPLIEVRGGSIYVSFPEYTESDLPPSIERELILAEENGRPKADPLAKKPKRRGKNAQG